MARPIRETPLLKGEDAFNFEWRRLTVDHMSKEQRAENRRKLEEQVARAAKYILILHIIILQFFGSNLIREFRIEYLYLQNNNRAINLHIFAANITNRMKPGQSSYQSHIEVISKSYRTLFELYSKSIRTLFEMSNPQTD